MVFIIALESKPEAFLTVFWKVWKSLGMQAIIHHGMLLCGAKWVILEGDQKSRMLPDNEYLMRLLMELRLCE